MSEASRCPQCGALLPDDAPAGLCPKCLVQAGFESEVEPEASADGSDPAVRPTLKSPVASGAGFEPPSLAELAPLFPQLEILELLGKGGMGAVYKARQRGLDRLVAIKILPPEIGHDAAFAERFTREARALARLGHPHIVAVYDFGQTPSPQPSPQGGEGVLGAPLAHLGRGAGGDGSLFYIVMEYVDGVNLRQTIQTGGLTPQSALAIVPQICEALQFAHDEGIVHRDIKPENILIDKKGRVKIADFGLAKLVGQDPREHFLTGTHQVMGTLRYMAPEQMQGSREVDHRADIYSLGVVFYELLTGELPMGKFAPPSKKVQVDVRLDEIVLRALEQEPEQRYQHASEVKTDMETISRTPELSRGAPPSALSESTSSEELKPITLLDETLSFWKRWMPVFPLLAGSISLLIAIPVNRTGNNPFPWLYTGWGLFLLGVTLALTFNVGWTVEYRGHRIRFEYNALKYKILMIDGWTAASGGIGWFYELRATIKEGQGIGDEINCTVEAAFILRCRIIALPKTPIAQAIESLARPESVKGVVAPAHPEPAGQSFAEPRISRFAIAGAVWAGLGVLPLILLTVFPVFGPERVPIGEASPPPNGLKMLAIAMQIFVVALAASSLFGTTIFGAISIGHIKRSGGRIVGLPLAVADALFFPLLAVFVAIAVPLAVALHSLFLFQLVVVAVPGAMLASIVCFVIGRTVWRSVASGVAGVEQSKLQDSIESQLPAAGYQPRPQSPATDSRRWRLGALAAVVGFVLFAVWFLRQNDMLPAIPVGKGRLVVQTEGSLRNVRVLVKRAGVVVSAVNPEVLDWVDLEPGVYELWVEGSWASHVPARLEVSPSPFTLAAGERQKAIAHLRKFESEDPARWVARGRDFDALQGRWVVVSQELGGSPVPPGVGPEWLEFEGDQIWFVLPSASRAVLPQHHFALDPAASPPQINLLGTGSRMLQGPGIYRIDGDNLTLCIGQSYAARPSQFKTNIDPSFTLTVCRRARKPKGDADFASGEADAATDDAKIQGTWTYVASLRDGQITDPEDLKRWSATFAQGEYTEQPGDRFEKGTYKLDPTKSPKTIDCLVTEGPYKGLPVAGIYEWDADTLKICWAHWGSLEHPQEFSATPGSQRALIVLKRETAADTTAKRARSEADSQRDALMQAAAQGEAGRVKELLDAGASVNAKDAEGQTPLMKAIAGGHRSLALTLVMLGADLTEQDTRGQSALMIAVDKGDATTLKRLSDLFAITNDSADKRQAGLRAFPGVERTLLAGRDIDLTGMWFYEAVLLRDENGETASIKAARAGDWECFGWLANHMDSVLACDKRRRTVLAHAVLGGQAERSPRWMELFHWLAKPLLFGVAGVDNVFVGSFLLFDLERSLSVLDEDGKSALQHAEELGQKEIAGILRRHLEAIVANQTAEIEKGGDYVSKHYRLRGLAWRALGEKEKAEADLKK